MFSVAYPAAASSAPKVPREDAPYARPPRKTRRAIYGRAANRAAAMIGRDTAGANSRAIHFSLISGALSAGRCLRSISRVPASPACPGGGGLFAHPRPRVATSGGRVRYRDGRTPAAKEPRGEAAARRRRGGRVPPGQPAAKSTLAERRARAGKSSRH